MRSRQVGRPIVLLAALAIIAMTPQRARAAVRICEPQVSSGLKTAPTETEARRMAVQAWIAAARSYGEAYTSWRLAIGKHLACSRRPDGKYQCLAKAEPCTIVQKPPPPDTVPRRTAPGVEG